MDGRVLVLKTDGSAEVTNFTAPVPLEFLQKAVGGYIEVVPDFDVYGGQKGVVAFCNEEGKLHGLPFNAQATDAWAKSVGANPNDLGDELLGDVAIVSGDDAFMGAL